MPAIRRRPVTDAGRGGALGMKKGNAGRLSALPRVKSTVLLPSRWCQFYGLRGISTANPENLRDRTVSGYSLT
jgi:hypothetical protein